MDLLITHIMIVNPTEYTVYLSLEPMTDMLWSRVSWRLYRQTFPYSHQKKYFKTAQTLNHTKPFGYCLTFEDEEVYTLMMNLTFVIFATAGKNVRNDTKTYFKYILDFRHSFICVQVVEPKERKKEKIDQW